MRKRRISIIGTFTGEKNLYSYKNKKGEYVDTIRFNIVVRDGDKEEVIAVVCYGDSVKYVLDLRAGDLVCSRGFFKVNEGKDETYVTFLASITVAISSNPLLEKEEVLKKYNEQKVNETNPFVEENEYKEDIELIAEFINDDQIEIGKEEIKEEKKYYHHY